MTNDSEVQMIPIDSIRILNPRERNKTKYATIVRSIKDAGMKRPITVSPRSGGGYDLICGQGRLEALKSLGQNQAPAFVRKMPREEQLLMSLVENLARLNPPTMELVRQLAAMRARGYTHSTIGKIVGLQRHHVSEYLYLLDHGEQRLISAVERGKISLTAAVFISRSDDRAVQAALTQALEEKKISSKDVAQARILADVRQSFGKTFKDAHARCKPVTADGIVRAFAKESQRQKVTIRKAELCEKRLLFVINALKALCRDDNFVNLLRAEGLSTLPQYLGKEIKGLKNG